ncbi:MAG: mevalonate kinase family protein [Fimbriimonas sp.]
MGHLISASAPGRCGILGNPSDIYGGQVLSCSIPARNTCHLTFGVESRLPEDLKLWDAATARFPLHEPVAVEWICEVPRSSGLAGSTALLAATLACVRARLELPGLESREMGELVRDLERHEAGVMCGYQDAQMVVHGGLQFMDFAGKHPVEPGPLPTLTALHPSPLLDNLLLVTTGVERLSGSVHGPMSERWLQGEPLVVDVIPKISALAQVGVMALASRDRAMLAEAMNENQRRIVELGGSGEAIDHLISRCMAHGAWAAKLAGAGMGGTIIAFTEDVNALERNLREEGYARFMRPGIYSGLVLHG